MNKVEQLYQEFLDLTESTAQLKHLAFIRYKHHTEQKGKCWSECVEWDNVKKDEWFAETKKLSKKEKEITDLLDCKVYQMGNGQYLVPMMDYDGCNVRFEILDGFNPSDIN